MIKRILLIALPILLFVTISRSQQRAQYSDYIMNNYLLNPAVGGTYGFWNAKIGHRSQWVGIDGGPRTSFISLHGPINYPDPRYRHRAHKPHHGVGGYAYTDRTGPITYNGLFLSYAYHHKLSRKVTSSFGAFGGIKEFRINGDEIKFVETEMDGLIQPGLSNTFIPDLNVGGFLYSDQFFVGVSAHQVLQSRLKIENSISTVDNEAKLRNHYFLTGGVKFELHHDIFFYPSFMIQYVKPAPTQVDINLRLMYSDFVWVAVAYRHLDAISIVAEYVINDTYEIGYAYDLNISELRKYNSGSHEIILGIRWADPKKEIMCPAKFW